MSVEFSKKFNRDLFQQQTNLVTRNNDGVSRSGANILVTFKNDSNTTFIVASEATGAITAHLPGQILTYRRQGTGSGTVTFDCQVSATWKVICGVAPFASGIVYDKGFGLLIPAIAATIRTATGNTFPITADSVTGVASSISSLGVGGLVAYTPITTIGAGILSETGGTVTSQTAFTTLIYRKQTATVIGFDPTNNTDWKVVHGTYTIPYHNGLPTTSNTLAAAPFGNDLSSSRVIEKKPTLIVKNNFGSSFSGIDGWDIRTSDFVTPKVVTTGTNKITFNLTGGCQARKTIPELAAYNGTVNVYIWAGSNGGGLSNTPTISINGVAGSSPGATGANIFQTLGSAVVLTGGGLGEVVLTYPTSSPVTTAHWYNFFFFSRVELSSLQQFTHPSGTTGTHFRDSYFKSLIDSKIFKNKVPLISSLSGGTFIVNDCVIPFSDDTDYFELANDGGYGASGGTAAGEFIAGGVSGAWQTLLPYNQDGSPRNDFFPKKTIPYEINPKVIFTGKVPVTTINLNITIDYRGDGIVLLQQTATGASAWNSLGLTNIDLTPINTNPCFNLLPLVGGTFRGYVGFTNTASGVISLSNSTREKLNVFITRNFPHNLNASTAICSNCVFLSDLKVIGIIGSLVNNVVYGTFRLTLNTTSAGSTPTPTPLTDGQITTLLTTTIQKNVILGAVEIHYGATTTLFTSLTDPTLLTAFGGRVAPLVANNYSTIPTFNDLVEEDFTVDNTSFLFRSGTSTSNIISSKLGLPVTWSPSGANPDTISDSATLYILGHQLRQFHYIGKDELECSIAQASAGINSSGVFTPDGAYNAPTDENLKTGRVGFYIKLTFDTSIYDSVSFPDWIFVETNSDVYLQLDLTDLLNPIVIGSQWIDKDGNLLTNGVNTENLIPLWKIGNVLSIDYKLYYPSLIHTFKGITAVAHQNTITNIDLKTISAADDQSVTSASRYTSFIVSPSSNNPIAENTTLPLNYIKSGLDVPGTVDLVNDAESTSISLVPGVAVNIPYGFNNIYTIDAKVRRPNSPADRLKLRNIDANSYTDDTEHNTPPTNTDLT